MLALLMEPYVMIQLSMLLQPHRTMVANFVQVISVCFGGTLRFRGTSVENRWATPLTPAPATIMAGTFWS